MKRILLLTHIALLSLPLLAQEAMMDSLSRWAWEAQPTEPGMFYRSISCQYAFNENSVTVGGNKFVNVSPTSVMTRQQTLRWEHPRTGLPAAVLEKICKLYQAEAENADEVSSWQLRSRAKGTDSLSMTLVFGTQGITADSAKQFLNGLFYEDFLKQARGAAMLDASEHVSLYATRSDTITGEVPPFNAARFQTLFDDFSKRKGVRSVPVYYEFGEGDYQWKSARSGQPADFPTTGMRTDICPVTRNDFKRIYDAVLEEGSRPSLGRFHVSVREVQAGADSTYFIARLVGDTLHLLSVREKDGAFNIPKRWTECDYYVGGMTHDYDRLLKKARGEERRRLLQERERDHSALHKNLTNWRNTLSRMQQSYEQELRRSDLTSQQREELEYQADYYSKLLDDYDRRLRELE